MQVTTKKTVTLDAVEIVDIITNHLREKGLLPVAQKYTAFLTDVAGMSTIQTSKESSSGTKLDKPNVMRIKIVWTPQ